MRHALPTASPRVRAPRRASVIAVAVTMVAAASMAAAAPALAGKGGPTSRTSGCSINPGAAAVGATYVVSVSGLPTGTAINLWVTAPDGTTTGSPLGSTPDGSFALNESSSSSGPWTYTFSGPTKQHTTIYADCSVTVS